MLIHRWKKAIKNSFLCTNLRGYFGCVTNNVSPPNHKIRISGYPAYWSQECDWEKFFSCTKKFNETKCTLVQSGHSKNQKKILIIIIYLLAFECREVLTTMELKLVPPRRSLYVSYMILAIPCLKLQVPHPVHLPTKRNTNVIKIYVVVLIISTRIFAFFLV